MNPINFHIQLITGLMLGIEFESDDEASVLVIDLLVLRLNFYKWKTEPETVKAKPSIGFI